MAEIRIEGKPVVLTADHLYLVYVDDLGEEWVIRSGAAASDGGGDIVVQYGVLLSESNDARPLSDRDERGSRVLDLGGRESADVWEVMLQQAQAIHEAGLDYDALTQNSNSTVASALHVIGVDVANVLPDQPNNYDWYPGRESILDSFAFTLAGTDGDDVLRGGRQGDALGGGRGDDRIEGLAGDDALSGHGGADTLRGGAGDDLLRGGGGRDVAVYSGEFAGYAMAWSWEHDGVLVEDLSGVEGRDLLRDVEFALFAHGMVETPLPPPVVGTAGDDTLEGGGSHDEIAGLGGDDILRGLAGGDDLAGNGGADSLRGGSGGDRLRGGYGEDALIGGAGRDVLRGGRGDDRLTGGEGVDRFALADGDGHDLARDFEGGVDILDLSAHSAAEGFGDLALTDEAAGLRIAFGGDSILLFGWTEAGFDPADILF